MMSTIKENTQKVADKVEASTHPVVSPVVKAARNLLLASIGAIAMSKDEIESLVDRLVEKGEITEKDGRKLVDDLVSRTKKMSQKVEKKTEEQKNKTEDLLNKRIQAVLNTMNIPSKQDIEDLSKKINTLSRKVSNLDKKLSSESTSKIEGRKPQVKKAA